MSTHSSSSRGVVVKAVRWVEEELPFLSEWLGLSLRAFKEEEVGAGGEGVERGESKSGDSGEGLTKMESVLEMEEEVDVLDLREGLPMGEVPPGGAPEALVTTMMAGAEAAAAEEAEEEDWAELGEARLLDVSRAELRPFDSICFFLLANSK